MYELFLETKAAQQCIKYAEAKNIDKETLLAECLEEWEAMRYRNGQCPVGQHLVSECLKGDLHKKSVIAVIFNWGKTKSGFHFWCNVDRYKVE